MKDLLYNAIQCPDGTVLTSRHRHDFVEHKQIDGREYFVDGGLDYQRVGYSDMEYTNLSIYTCDDHLLIREHFEWGTYGKYGTQTLKYIKLKDITDDHLKALYGYNGLDKINKVFSDEIRHRNLRSH